MTILKQLNINSGSTRGYNLPGMLNIHANNNTPFAICQFYTKTHTHIFTNIQKILF